MIETQFGFTSDPFSLTADSTIFYRSRQHALAEKFLEYALESRGPFALLTGEVGCGKSLLVSRLLGKLGDDVTVVLVNRPYSQLDSLRGILTRTLGIPQGAGTDADAYEELLKGFQQRYEQGKRTLLVVDESQNLSVQALEDLRLLSNANPKETFLQILLVGQTELRAKLHRTELRQFEQRISAQFHLEPLSDGETRAYIVYRLQAAGGDADLFTSEALDFIYAHTGGVPRLINQLCHYALAQASTSERKRVDLDVMHDMAQEFRGGLAFEFEKKADRPSTEAAIAPGPVEAAPAVEAVTVTAPEPEFEPVAEPVAEPVVVAEADTATPVLPPAWQAARIQSSTRRPAIAAACALVAGFGALVVWEAHRPAPPVAAATPAAAAPVHDVAPPPPATDAAIASTGEPVTTSPTPPVAAAPAARPPATTEAVKPKSAAAPVARTASLAHPAGARASRVIRRAIERVNRGDTAGAERLMARASADGARPQELADLRSRIDAQKLEVRLASSADRVKAAIAKDSLLDPAPESAEKRYEEMSRLGPNDPLTERTRHDLQRALVTHAQDATSKGEFDAARRFLDAAAKTGPSAEVNAAEEKLRQEISRTARPQASTVLAPTAPSDGDNAGQKTATDASIAQEPTHR
jgi:general secretion pathway protein A